MNNLGRISVLVFLILCGAFVSVAQWSSDPSTNIPVVTGGYGAADVILLKDGAGGAFVVWDDMRVGDGNPKAFAQHFDKAGHAKWTANGVEVCPRGADQARPQAAVVGDGSLIVSWAEQYRDSVLGSPVTAIFAQRISSSGSLMWGDSALPFASPNYLELHYPLDIGAMTSDGHGGAYICWSLLQSGLQELVMTRLDSTGGNRWTNAFMNGGGLIGGYVQESTIMVDTGHVFVSWWDTRFLFHGQLLNSSGVAQWDSLGVALALNGGFLNSEQHMQAIPDGAGGAIYAWEQEFSGSSPKPYAGRINASGKLLWVTSTDSLGIKVDSTIGGSTITLTPAGSGSAILTWNAGSDIVVAQKIAADGSYPWGFNPTPFVANAAHAALTTDDNGGAILAWNDSRNNTSIVDIYAQDVNGSGQPVWTNASSDKTGNPVSTAAGWQENPVLVSDDAGGAIIAWYDYRTTGFGGPADVYTQHIGNNGSVTKVTQQSSGVPSQFALMQNYPNPFNPSTMIQFTVPSSGRAVLKVFNILGQEVATLFDGQASAGISHQVVFNASNYASGIYFSKLEFDGKTDIKKMMLLK